MKTSTKQISAQSPAAATPCCFDYAGQFSALQDVPMHRHEGCELVFIARGRCIIDIEAGPSLPADEGVLCIVPAKARHNQRHFEHTNTSFVSFRADKAFFDDRARSIAVGVDAPIGEWITQMNMLQTQGPGKRAVSETLLQTALLWINTEESDRSASPLLHPALARAVALIRKRLFEVLRVEEIAAQAYVSPGYLIALFRTRFGIGPLHYQQQLRMDRARQLLTMPYLTVSQVARECGYDDANYFGRLFKQHTGASPRTFRATRLGIRPGRSGPSGRRIATENNP